MSEGIDNNEPNKISVKSLLVKAYEANYATIANNNKHFETKITYISAGLIVLSFAFIDGRATCNMGLFIIGNSLATIALILNLTSFFYGNKLLRKDAAKFLELKNKYETSTNIKTTKEDIQKTMLGTNDILVCFNLLTFAALVAGIILIAIFLILNIT